MKAIVIFLISLLMIPGWSAGQGKKNASYYYYEGEQALEENKYNLALAHYNECIRLDPYFMEAYHSRAAAKEGLGVHLPTIAFMLTPSLSIRTPCSAGQFCGTN